VWIHVWDCSVRRPRKYGVDLWNRCGRRQYGCNWFRSGVSPATVLNCIHCDGVDYHGRVNVEFSDKHQGTQWAFWDNTTADKLSGTIVVAERDSATKEEVDA